MTDIFPPTSQGDHREQHHEVALPIAVSPISLGFQLFADCSLVHSVASKESEFK
jgi:hypothetical protein